jgi:ABC-type bacteriocin/lantibiotic exporter with double-glycine peptidase domain
MVVLDEPTSALDVDSEELVTDALRGLPEHVIVVLIAHRMSTLRHCNRVVVLEDGQMTASGSTAETVEGNLFFRRAVEAGAFSPGA